MNEIIQPKDMDWIENGVLGIEWSDGHKGVYPVRYLRQHCPCAACTDEWTGELRIKPDAIQMLIAVKDIEPVGRYGLAGRGVAVCLVGIYWISAAIQGEPSKAHELGGALQAVQQNSQGWLLLLTLGLALAASAFFDFVEAFYHRPRLAAHVPS